MLGGSSRKLLARRLRTVKRFRLKSSPGSVVRQLDAKNSFNLGSNFENTPWVTVGTRVNVASGRIVVLDKVVRH